MSIRLGAIADDYTGATDLGSVLSEQGLRVLQYNEVPSSNEKLIGIDVVIIALKSRSIAPTVAVSQALEALTFLESLHPEQYYFKYCSTFDSTDQGNIGPVMEAMMDHLDVDQTIVCPAFPINGRSVYKGHLYVGDKLLSDTHMRHHPLNPMTDANLVSCLGRQCDIDVALIDYNVVDQGVNAIRSALQLKNGIRKIHIVDAIKDQHLIDIIEACDDLQLITGASGLGVGYRGASNNPKNSNQNRWKPAKGIPAVLCGSCSEMSLNQISYVQSKWPSYKIDVSRLDEDLLAGIESWIVSNIEQELPLLIYSSESATTRSNYNPVVSTQLENLMATIGKLLISHGITQLVVAGGETSGAVLKGLGISKLEIGPTIAPGVPWTNSKQGDEVISLALKSGNFGDKSFFEDAFNILTSYE